MLIHNREHFSHKTMRKKSLSTLPLKKNKNINRPPVNKTIRKIKFGKFYIYGRVVVMNASFGHQNKINNIHNFSTIQILMNLVTADFFLGITVIDINYIG